MPTQDLTAARDAPGRQSPAMAWYAVVVGVLLVALVLRWLAAQGELWLDEVWSLTDAIDAASVHEILTLNNVDNNHPLNSIWLHFMGDGRASWVYRLLSLAGGMVSVGLGALYARRWGVTSALVVLVLLGVSHPLIHYASEARGYAPALGCAFGALLALDRFMERKAFRPAAVFSICVILGTLSHLLFLQVYVALFVWSVGRAWMGASRRTEVLRTLSRAHLLPSIFLVYYFIFHLQHLTIAGGPSRGMAEALLHTAALFAGLPRTDAVGATALVVLFGLGAAALVAIARTRRDHSALMVLWIILMPGVMLLIARPSFLFERYFLFSGALMLVLAGRTIAALIAGSGARRWLGGALLGAFIVGNLWQVNGLVRHGRGHYRDLILHIDQHHTDPVVLTGDQDFRHSMMLRHFARPPLTHTEFRYFGFYVLPPHGAEWYVTHLRAPWQTPPPRITDRWNHPYELSAAYRSDTLSGYHLFLYRRVEDAAPVPTPSPEPRSPP